MTDQIGITERADPTVNLKWIDWVKMGRPAILITKDPAQLGLLLPETKNVTVHCTITGLGGTVMEPNIPPVESSIPAYHALCRELGKDRVVLRIDPIVDEVALLTYKILTQEAEGRVRISFLDLYPHVLTRFKERGVALARSSFHMPLKQRFAIWEYLGKPEVCGEPGMSLAPCVSKLDCEVLGVRPSLWLKGQRKACTCLANKTELCAWPPKCTYGCLYCYWK